MLNIAKAESTRDSIRAILSHVYARDYSKNGNLQAQSSLRILVSSVKDIIPNESSFLEKQIGIQQFMISPLQTAETAANILDSFVRSQKPFFMNDLLENARSFVDLNMFELAAYCVRTYAEISLKIQTSEHFAFDKYTKTLGKMNDKLHDGHIIDDERYAIDEPIIRRINNIVHKDGKYAEKPTNKDEMLQMIEWAIDYERYMRQIDWHSTNNSTANQSKNRLSASTDAKRDHRMTE